MLTYQGVNQGLIGAGKRSLPNWINQTIFLIEFMLTAKFLVFFFVLVNVHFHSQYFLGLFNQVRFLEIFTAFAAFFFLALHKKRSYPLTISSVNVTKSAGNCGFGHVYWRNLSWKTPFFVQCGHFLSFMYLMYRVAVENMCTLRPHSGVLSLDNRFFYMFVFCCSFE